MKAILFLNGKEPKLSQLTKQHLNQFSLRIATDGAYNYLKNNDIKIDIVIGDMDSVAQNAENEKPTFITITDQNTTDFEKALQYLIENNYNEVVVFGANGKHSDHFLGNLSAAIQFNDKLRITFIDKYFKYFFLTKNKPNIFDDVQGKIISLFPFHEAKNITTKGLEFPLQHEDLHIEHQIGIRNKAIENQIEITFTEGNLLIFIQQ